MLPISSVGLAAGALLIGYGAMADDSLVTYKDANWGVVRQNNGHTCIVVLNTDDRRHAFHFLIDGENKTAQLGILGEYLPDRGNQPIANVLISVDAGPGFVQKMEFGPASDGRTNDIAALLKRNDLDRIRHALEVTSGVTVSFSAGDTWQIRAPRTGAAAIAIDRCWKDAVIGISGAAPPQ
jgi:hypothetical protein